MRRNAYLCGVVDGEGSFSISVKPHNTTRFGWVIDATFSVTLERGAEHVLIALQETLGCGRIIDKPAQPSCKLFLEQSRKNIAGKIIPFFQQHPLEIKARSFEHFSEIVRRLEHKEHSESESFLRLAALALSHTEAKGKRKHTIADLLGSMKNKPVDAARVVQVELARIAKTAEKGI